MEQEVGHMENLKLFNAVKEPNIKSAHVYALGIS